MHSSPRTPPRVPASPHPLRILLARPDHLGDVLLTLPAVDALRRIVPGARIDYLVAPAAAAVPAHCPTIDETLTVPFPPPTAPPDPPGWAGIVAREAAALRGRYDLALLPRLDDPWGGALVAAAGIPARIGYAHPRTRPYLTEALPIPEGRHVALLARDLVAVASARLGAPVSPERAGDERRFPPAVFVPTVEEEAEVAALLATLAGSGEPSDPALRQGPIVLHPGSGWPLKNWPARDWGALAIALARRYGVVPLVTGGMAEGALVDAVVRTSDGHARGLAGRLSLGGLAALYARARLVIATDGGPLHLAAAMSAPVIGLYGPADPVEFGPWRPPDQQRIVRVQLPCSPCGRLADPPCGARLEPACVTGITLEAVLAAVNELLGPERRQAVCHDQ